MVLFLMNNYHSASKGLIFTCTKMMDAKKGIPDKKFRLLKDVTEQMTSLSGGWK